MSERGIQPRVTGYKREGRTVLTTLFKRPDGTPQWMIRRRTYDRRRHRVLNGNALQFVLARFASLVMCFSARARKLARGAARQKEDMEEARPRVEKSSGFNTTVCCAAYRPL